MQSPSVLMEIMWMEPNTDVTCQNKLRANLLSVRECFSPPRPHGLWSHPQRDTEMSWGKKLLPPVAAEHFYLSRDGSFMARYNFSCASPELTAPCCPGDNYLCVAFSVPQGQTTLWPLPLLTAPSAPRVPATLLPLTNRFTLLISIWTINYFQAMHSLLLKKGLCAWKLVHFFSS